MKFQLAGGSTPCSQKGLSGTLWFSMGHLLLLEDAKQMDFV